MRGQQLDLIVKKLDETVEKFHTLTLDVMKMLTAHTGQIQDLQTRVGENTEDIEQQAAQLQTSRDAFLQAMKEATRELATANQEEMKAGRDEAKELLKRIENLEKWRYWIMGCFAVLGALSFFVDGPTLAAKIFGN